MGRLLFKALTVGGLLAAYLSSPMITAWNIREAAKAGDTAYLKDKIEWQSVQATLTPSLQQYAFNLPDPAQGAKPGLWQSFKARVGGSILNKTIESYMTPEGLPKLFAYRQAYRQHVAREAEEPKTLFNLPDRMQKFWARVKRAEFLSATSFEIDFADKTDPNRIYTGLLEFKGFEWKLTELRIRSAAPSVLPLMGLAGAGQSTAPISIGTGVRVATAAR
jgi:hypothetical protein